MTTLLLPRAVRQIAPLATLLTATLILAGCGGSSNDDAATTTATTAAATQAGGQVQSALADDVPAKAAAFVELTIRPQGGTQAAIDEIAGAVGVSDPGAAIVKALDLNDKLDSGGTVEKDVLPHIGDHLAAFALAGPSSSGKSGAAAKANGAVVAEVQDADALRTALLPEFEKDTEKIQVDGQTVYRKTDGKAAAWFGEKLLAVGTEDAVRATIAATKGDTLADNERFKNALAQVRGSDAAGVAWVDLQQADTLNGLIQSASSQDELKDLAKKGAEGQLSQLGRGSDALEKLTEQDVLPKIDATVAVSLQAQSGQIKIEAGGTSPADKQAAIGTGDAAKALAKLPAGSWLALGASLTDLSSVPGLKGSSPADALDLISSLTGTKFSPELRSGLDKIRTLAIAVRGDSLTSIGGAVVLQTADAAAATSLMDELTALATKQGGLHFKKHAVPGADAGLTAQLGSLPVQLVVGTKGDHLAIGLGTDAVAGALGNGSTLADDPVYAQAKDLLGGDAPVLLLNPQPVAALIGSLPMDGANQAVQAIERIKVIAASTARTSPTTWRSTFAVRYDPKPAAKDPAGTTTTTP